MGRWTWTVAILVLMIAGTATAPAAGQAPASGAESAADEATTRKKPWEWTLDERIALRFDPALIAEREKEERARKRAAGVEPLPDPPQSPHNHGIDGDRNPELLLPHELLRSLISGFMPDDERRTRWRESLRRDLVAAGFDEELFWAQLRSATSRYVDTFVYPATGAIDDAASRERHALCREEFLALESARQVFGREQFDRFLYEAIAPRTRAASVTNAPDPAAELRFFAGGCH